jgi:hypothetical protein
MEEVTGIFRRMRRTALALPLVMMACDPSTPTGPEDAGDAAAVDAPLDAPPDDAVAADAAPDGPAPDAGSPGYCESQWKGPSHLVLGVTPSGGSALYRVYPGSAWDEHVVDLVYNGNKLSIADMAFDGVVYRVTNGAAWWTMNLPLGSGTRELGAPIGVGPNGTPPAISHVAPGGPPWIGRSGTSFTRITLSPLVDWVSNGNVLGAGATCTDARDFLSGGGGGVNFSYLATCGVDPNAVVNVTVQKDVNGNWTGTSSIGTLPSAPNALVIAVAGSTYLTATKIYTNGVYVRDLKVCLNDGNLSAPIAGLRAIVSP